MPDWYAYPITTNWLFYFFLVGLTYTYTQCKVGRMMELILLTMAVVFFGAWVYKFALGVVRVFQPNHTPQCGRGRGDSVRDC